MESVQKSRISPCCNGFQCDATVCYWGGHDWRSDYTESGMCARTDQHID